VELVGCIISSTHSVRPLQEVCGQAARINAEQTEAQERQYHAHARPKIGSMHEWVGVLRVVLHEAAKALTVYTSLAQREKAIHAMLAKGLQAHE
jgi:hypothetical protein